MNRLIIYSTICGVFLTVVNFLWNMSSGTDMEKIGITQVLGLLLPGPLFAFILCDVFKKGLNGKKCGFIVLSGILFIIIALLSAKAERLMRGFPVGIIYYCFISGIGALSLFILYYLIIDPTLNMVKGIGLAFILGFAAGLIPAFLLYRLEISHYKTDFDEAASWIIIFMIWQPLFTVSLKLSQKPSI